MWLDGALRKTSRLISDYCNARNCGASLSMPVFTDIAHNKLTNFKRLSNSFLGLYRQCFELCECTANFLHHGKRNKLILVYQERTLPSLGLKKINTSNMIHLMIMSVRKKQIYYNILSVWE